MRLGWIFVSLAICVAAGPAAAASILITPATVDASSGQVSFDVSTSQADVIQFSLDAAFDTSYLQLVSIDGASVVSQDLASGFLNDINADVGSGDPIPAFTTLFTLVFDVVGDPAPKRQVLEVGDLSGLDAFFSRPTLIGFEIGSTIDFTQPGPNGVVLTPEPASAALELLGLAGLSRLRRRAWPVPAR